MMRYRVRTFLRLWRWRRDLAWRRALILDTLRGRLEIRAPAGSFGLEQPPARRFSRLIVVPGVCVVRWASSRK